MRELQAELANTRKEDKESLFQVLERFKLRRRKLDTLVPLPHEAQQFLIPFILHNASHKKLLDRVYADKPNTIDEAIEMAYNHATAFERTSPPPPPPPPLRRELDGGRREEERSSDKRGPKSDKGSLGVETHGSRVEKSSHYPRVISERDREKLGLDRQGGRIETSSRYPRVISERVRELLEEARFVCDQPGYFKSDCPKWLERMNEYENRDRFEGRDFYSYVCPDETRYKEKPCLICKALGYRSK